MTDQLSIDLRPSPMLAAALTLMAGVALGCAWISLPGVALVPVAAGISLAWGAHMAQALHRGKGAARALEVGAQGSARWQDGSGQWQETEILASSYASDWLLVVHLGSGGGRERSLVLLPDSAEADDLRRLRVWLRWRLRRA